VAAPGLAKDFFHVDLTNNILHIRYEIPDEGSAFFARRSFSRSWRVAQTTTPEDINATYNNGVLVVTVHKTSPTEAETTAIVIN
jgi:HSP20 family molecular chaperone IbpA